MSGRTSSLLALSLAALACGPSALPSDADEAADEASTGSSDTGDSEPSPECEIAAIVASFSVDPSYWPKATCTVASVVNDAALWTVEFDCPQLDPPLATLQLELDPAPMGFPLVVGDDVVLAGLSEVYPMTSEDWFEIRRASDEALLVQVGNIDAGCGYCQGIEDYAVAPLSLREEWFGCLSNDEGCGDSVRAGLEIGLGDERLLLTPLHPHGQIAAADQAFDAWLAENRHGSFCLPIDTRGWWLRLVLLAAPS